MTAKEILDRFNTPTQIQIDQINKEANGLRNVAHRMINKANRISNRAYDLSDKADEEANEVADQLDKDFPQWRVVLIRDCRKQ